MKLPSLTEAGLLILVLAFIVMAYDHCTLSLYVGAFGLCILLVGLLARLGRNGGSFKRAVDHVGHPGDDERAHD